MRQLFTNFMLFFVFCFLLTSCVISEEPVGALDLKLSEYQSVVLRGETLKIKVEVNADNLTLDKVDETKAIIPSLSNVDSGYFLNITISDKATFGQQVLEIDFKNGQQQRKIKVSLEVVAVSLKASKTTIYTGQQIALNLDITAQGIALEDLTLKHQAPPQLVVSSNAKNILNITALTTCSVCEILLSLEYKGRSLAQQTLKVLVRETPKLDLTLSTKSLSLAAGTQKTLIANANLTNSDTPISLTVRGIVNGLSVALPQTLNGQQVITISADDSLAPGAYSLVFQAKSGEISDEETLAINVLAKPDFTLSPSPSQVNLISGQTAQATLTAVTKGGFSDNINVFITGLPAGMSAQAPAFNPVSGTTTITINSIKQLAKGIYPLTIIGMAAGIERRTQLVVNVTQPDDFRLTLLPASQNVEAGKKAYMAVAATGTTEGAINLIVSGLPSGITATNSAIVSIGATTTLEFVTTNDLSPGTYTFTIFGVAPSGLRKNIQATLVVTPKPSFSISLAKASLAIEQGTSHAEYKVTINRDGSFAGAVVLELTNISGTLPTGLFASTIITTASSYVFKIDITNTPLGIYQLQLKGTNIDGSLISIVPIELIITPVKKGN